MNTDPELAQGVHAFLQDGVDRMPERVYRGAMDVVPATRQRRSSWFQPRVGPPCRVAGTVTATAASPVATMNAFARSGRPGGGSCARGCSRIPISRTCVIRLPTDVLTRTSKELFVVD